MGRVDRMVKVSEVSLGVVRFEGGEDSLGVRKR